MFPSSCGGPVTSKRAASAKTGFCFLDSYTYRSKEPSKYNQASFVCQLAPNRTVPMGISVQWGDVYRSTIAFQWIDITGLPDGDYLIEIIADPPMGTDGQFQESDESNNRGWATIRLRGSTVKMPRAARAHSGLRPRCGVRWPTA